MILRFGFKVFSRNPQFRKVPKTRLPNRLCTNSPSTTSTKKPLIPITKWNREFKAPGHYIGLKEGATMWDVLGEIDGCDYELKYDSEDAFAGEFDDKALGILQQSPYVREIKGNGYEYMGFLE